LLRPWILRPGRLGRALLADFHVHAGYARQRLQRALALELDLVCYFRIGRGELHRDGDRAIIGGDLLHEAK
jgi:hypothetical protein